MNDILVEIINQKKIEVQALAGQSYREKKRSDTRRPFGSALKRQSGAALIAEVKKASPSRGIIKHDFDHCATALTYEQGGAHAISVLTDERFFMGKLSYLNDIRSKVTLPLLRKDFIIDPLQVEEAAAANADALLLIAAALSQDQMKELYAAARELDVEVLIEVHDRGELERVLDISAPLIGINNRNLRTFTTDINLTLDLIPFIPQSATIISESGIENGTMASRLLAGGAHAFLVGESLMRHTFPLDLMKELLDAR